MPTNDLQRPQASTLPSADVLRFFHPVMPAARLRKEPIGVRIAERDYVLFRDHAGRPGALDDACPHRRAPLSRGRVQRDGRLACGYHGWSFDTEGRGRSPSSPGLQRCDTRAYRLIERLGYLWIAHRDVPESSFPEIPSDGLEFAGSISARFDASMEVTLDNISEDEHFAFVHSTFGWSAREASAVEIETATFADRSEVRLSGIQRRSLLAPLGGVRRGDRFRNQWVTRFAPVHAIYTFWWEDARSGAKRPITTRAAVFLVPETPLLTRAHMFLFLGIAPSLQRRFRPVSHWLARRIATLELERDAHVAAQLAGQPTTLRGMRLTKFDEALIHNRKLLRRLYWEERPTAEPATTGAR